MHRVDQHSAVIKYNRASAGGKEAQDSNPDRHRDS
jgi:hypothetical protein